MTAPILALLAGAPMQAPAPEAADAPSARAEVEADELRRHDFAAGDAQARLISWLWADSREPRRRLSERGVDLDLLLSIDLSSHFEGGADPGSSAARGLFEAIVTADAGRAFGLQGGILVAGLQVIDGDDGSKEVGVLQNYSNVDAADDRVQFARAWYEQAFAGGATRVRVGKMDANSLFATVESALRFIHSSMAFSPTIRAFPTYPDTAFGAAAMQALPGGLDLRLGIFDGAAQEGVRTGERGAATLFGDPSDLFGIGELGLRWDPDGEQAGRAALGAWRHTGGFGRYDGGREDGTEGLYAVVEQRLLRDAQGRTLDAFLQLGEADPDVSPFSRHVGAGVAAARFLLPRCDDALGLGFSAVRLSDEAGAGFDEDREVAIEAFWGLSLAPGVRVKPDLQYVLHPGGDSTLDDAWIATLRVTFSF